MIISIIAAMGLNRTLGKDGGIPWKLEKDLKHFKERTMGKVIIMGRKTYESLPVQLRGRFSIVLTRNKEFVGKGDAKIVFSLEGALNEANRLIKEDSNIPEEVMIIGGGEIYSLFLPLTTNMYLSILHKEVDGDVFFPKFNLENDAFKINKWFVGTEFDILYLSRQSNLEVEML